MRVSLIVKRRRVPVAGLCLVVALLAAPSAAAGARTSTDPVIPVAADEASAAGIGQTSITMGAVVTDANGDGLPDLFVDHHATGPGQLFLNDGGGTFTLDAAAPFPLWGERLGCDAADADRDGRVDIACAQGADHGVGIKRNELWIQGDGLTFSQQATARGVADPFGRSRQALFLDANRDGWQDLLVTNDSVRYDGLPSPDRFFINHGGSFADAPSFGLDLFTPARSLGTGCLRSVDVNGDHYPDVLLCASDHLRMLVNQSGTHFVDQSAQYRVDTDSPNDAVLVDVDGDGQPDLVDVKSKELSVRLQSDGVFQAPAYTLPLVNGVGVATGDVNGDGTPDVYVVQAEQGTSNAPDVMLLNASVPGTVSFVQMTVPEVDAGTGQWAYPLDYDSNGLTDFLVLNGQNRAGPLQLLAFFAPGGAPASGHAHGPRGSSGAAARGRAEVSATRAPCGPSFGAIKVSRVPGENGTVRINHFAGTAADGWAVGTLRSTAPLIEHWDGTAWSEVATPPLGADTGLNGVVRIARDEAWAVGFQLVDSKKLSLAERWDGSSWSVTPTADPGSGGNILTAVDTTPGAPVMAVGYQVDGSTSQSLIERWHPTAGAWVEMTEVAGSWEQAALTGLLVPSSGQAWAVGWTETGGTFHTLAEHWDGTAWTLVDTPQVAGADSALFLAAAADGTGGLWATGYAAKGSRYRTLAEHFDGTSWTVTPTVDSGATATILRAVTTVSPNDVWAAGFNQDSGGLYDPLLEHWDGMSWNVFEGADLTEDDDAPLQAAATLAGEDVWAGGVGANLEHMCPYLVTDAGFVPSRTRVGQGLSVLWQIPASDVAAHSVTDASGLGLYDSGMLSPGSTYVTSYWASGGYVVSDDATGSTTKVDVAPDAEPPSGPVGSSFTITWATGDAPSGFAFDVQVKIPGSTAWSPWMSGATSASATYVPAAAGVYSFRARLDRLDPRRHTLFGPSSSISAT